MFSGYGIYYPSTKVQIALNLLYEAELGMYS